jgi:hypothetical protein
MLMFPYQAAGCADDLGGADFDNGADTVPVAEDEYTEPVVLSDRGDVMKVMTPSVAVAVAVAVVSHDFYQHDDDYEFAFAAELFAVPVRVSAFLVPSGTVRQLPALTPDEVDVAAVRGAALSCRHDLEH